MAIRWACGSLLSGAIALAMALPAFAQANASGTRMAPDYDSGASAGSLSDSNFNTPESDGRPGVKFFTYAVQAFKKGDYRHAVDMYKVAASWAYKAAEYNLGLMYFKGQGVPVNRALGAAWMVLAAERGDPTYVRARDLMVTALTKAEFAHTDEIWNQLKPTYGDAVALRRAKAQWNWVGSHGTGTHIAGGIPGNLRVGEHARTGAIGTKIVPTTAAGVLSAGSIDGSVAYRQFQRSSNPYDPVFLKHRAGTITVGPLQPIRTDDRHPLPQKPAAPSSTQQPPRNA